MRKASTLSKAGVPSFSLYGEPPQHVGERFVHIEPIAARSRARGWRIAPHVHDDLHHALLLLEGHAEVQADEIYGLYPAPALLIVPVGFVHTFNFRVDTDGYVITASDSFIRSLAVHEPAFGELFAETLGVRLSAEDVQRYELQSTAHALLHEQQSSVPARTMLIEARAQFLLAQVARIVSRPAAGNANIVQLPRAPAESTVAEFRKLIESHFHEGWPLKRYAEEMCISMAQLRCNCIRVTGSPPIKLLHERILREAKRSLRFTKRSVTQIAHDLGFRDSAYFSRFFRTRLGVAPTAFRRSSIPIAAAASANTDTMWQNSRS